MNKITQFFSLVLIAVIAIAGFLYFSGQQDLTLTLSLKSTPVAPPTAGPIERLKNNLLLILALLVAQVVLGIMNVVLSLPMLVAVLHNTVALGLLLSLIGLLHKIVNNPKA